MVGLSDMQHVLYLPTPFGKIPSASDEAACSCAKLAAESIDMCNANCVIGRIAYDFPLMCPYDFTVDFVPDFLSERDTVLVEMIENDLFVLVVSIGAEMDLVLIVWLLSSLGDEGVELIAGFDYPFADAEADEEVCFSFQVEIAVRVTGFRVTEPSLGAPRLFFLMNVQSSSISCVPSFTSRMRRSFTSSQC